MAQRVIYAPSQFQKQSLPIKTVDLPARRRDDWARTKAATIAQAPGFAHVLFTMMVAQTGKDPVAIFVDDPKRIPVAATDGVNLYINPESFFAEYNIYERVFVMVHEVLHNIFDHCGMGYVWQKAGKVKYPDGKSLPYIHDLMGVAADYVINALLVESKIGKLPAAGGLYDPKIASGSDAVIDVYRKLYVQAKKEGRIVEVGVGSGSGKGKGDSPKQCQGLPDTFDKLLDPGTGAGQDPDTASAGRNHSQWATEVAAGLAAAKAQGLEMGGLAQLLGEFLAPKVTWQNHLQALFARKIGSGSYDWRRPDRALIVRDIYAPGRSGFGAGTVAIGLDTSGSIVAEPRTLDQFMGEMASILDEVRPKRLVLLWCDAHVHRVDDEVEEPSDLHTIRAKGAPGGGGTSFVPVFDKIDELGLELDALVYLTDGQGTFPAEAPRYPVIWGSTFMPESHYPFGEVVRIPVGG